MKRPRIVHSVAWNLLGAGLPVVAAILLIPRVIEAGGEERFGLLGIIWVLIGYFSLFDLGLGKALTKFVSERIARQDVGSIAVLARSALLLMSVLGCLIFLLVEVSAEFLVVRLLNVPSSLAVEATSSVRIMALALPFVIVSTAFVGILESYQRFDQINFVRMPLGVLNFVFPYVAFNLYVDLRLATALLAVLRIIACIIYALQANVAVKGLLADRTIEKRALKPLLSFGGWLSVSNLVGPLMVYSDRFFVGSLIGLAAVAHYITPYEVVTRLWVLPVAVIDVLFPALTAAYAVDAKRLVRLFRSAVEWIALVMAVPVGVIFLFASELLQFWLAESFDPASVSVARWLVIGVFVNSLCRVPLVMLLGAGRPGLVAKMHLSEIVPYVAAMMWLVMNFGIEGAAIAWMARVSVEALLLFFFASSAVQALRSAASLGVLLAFSIPLLLLLANQLAESWLRVATLFLAGLVVFGCAVVKFRKLRRA